MDKLLTSAVRYREFPDSEGRNEEASESLRSFGRSFAKLIRSRPDRWTDEAHWLNSLPVPCQSDSALEEHIGPIVLCLSAAWSAVVGRFAKRPRRDRFFDFGVMDAGRIGLWSALMFDRDFDGTELGLCLPWDDPVSTGATLDGRGWAWAVITSRPGAESWSLILLRQAVKYFPNAETVREKIWGDPTKSVDPAVPVWDEERGELRLGSEICKTLRKSAKNQIPILEAFQKGGWPFCVDDPLTGRARTDPKRRLNTTIRDLNRDICWIRFRGDTSGKGVSWELLP